MRLIVMVAFGLLGQWQITSLLSYEMRVRPPRDPLRMLCYTVVMIEPNIYCKVSGMVMQCIHDFYHEHNKKPVVLEIGCADGLGTMRFAGFTEFTVCIDPMISGRPDIVSTVFEELKVDEAKLRKFFERTVDFGCVKLIIGCSSWIETMNAFKVLLDSRQIDILVIDGCHHPFEAVWQDFADYYPFVSKNGYVIFDDLYEDCILQAYEKALSDHGVIKHDRWWIKNDSILQDVAALKKIEE